MSSLAHRVNHCLALLATEAALYFSGPGCLWITDFNGNQKQRLAWDTKPNWFKYASRYRLLRRLCRLDLRELILAADGGLLGIGQRRILRLDRAETELRTVFEVKDGGRPKGFALTPEGQLFVGEYWGNPQRQSLRIWGSADHGENWELAYVLPEKSAKHIHNLIWDPYRQGLWVLTGDADAECALLFTADEFRTVTEVVRGEQIYRACHLFCRPEGLYYGTDSERTPNWFLHLDVENGKIEKIQPLPGSCIHAAQMAGIYLLSTSVEPSKINCYKKTVLWTATDLDNWKKIIEFDKDLWPGEYFGFGSIVLPRVQGECPVVVFSTIAVKDTDLTTFIMPPEGLSDS